MGRRVVGTIPLKKLSKSSSVSDNSSTDTSSLYNDNFGDDLDIFLKGDSEIIVEKTKDANGDDVIILKSESDIIDIPLPVVRKKLASLFEVKDVNLTELSKKHKDELQNITSIMSGLYNTNCYDEIIFQINEIFGKGGPDIKPGTVYSYFYGCKTRSDFSPYSCSPICAGSIQPTDMGNGWTVCDKFAILYDCDKNKFSLLNNPANKEEAYIFIPSGCKFNGFNTSEVKSLERLGVRSVMVIVYDKNNASKTEPMDTSFRPLIELTITSGAVQTVVDKVKEEIQNVSNNNNQSTGSIVFWVFLIIIILLIIAALIYLIVAYSGKNKYPSSKNSSSGRASMGQSSRGQQRVDLYKELGRGRNQSGGNAITEALL